jgi:hypothetical protein
MKYSSQLIIELPKEQTILKFDNAENLKHWQKGLTQYKQLSGEPGSKGAKMQLDYKMSKRELTMIETIIKNDLPDSLITSYDTKGVYNIQKNSFETTPDGHTKWISESEFKFTNVMMKIMGFLMPGVFKKQSLKYMKDFKAFAEDNKSVLD